LVDFRGFKELIAHGRQLIAEDDGVRAGKARRQPTVMSGSWGPSTPFGWRLAALRMTVGRIEALRLRAAGRCLIGEELSVRVEKSGAAGTIEQKA
jgi:hypothetical protein